MTTRYQLPVNTASRYGSQYGGVGQKIGMFQDMASESVRGYGSMLGRDFQKQVGVMLGGLNDIGALRSGRVQSELGDLSDQYGRSVGEYASMATRDAMGMGQTEYDRDVERKYREDADRRARKSSKWGALGKLGGLALSVAFPAKTFAAKVGQGIIGGGK